MHLRNSDKNQFTDLWIVPCLNDVIVVIDQRDLASEFRLFAANFAIPKNLGA